MNTSTWPLLTKERQVEIISKLPEPQKSEVEKLFHEGYHIVKDYCLDESGAIEMFFGRFQNLHKTVARDGRIWDNS